MVSDEEYVQKHSLGIPLYYKIPYMLVSLECLSNSHYLKLAKEKNLLQEFNLSMGKYNCLYVDKRIQKMSFFSRLWIDRNLALDYFFKSMMKIKSKEISIKLEKLRYILKSYSYELLGIFLAFTLQDTNLLPLNAQGKVIEFIQGLSVDSDIYSSYESIINFQFSRLQKDVDSVISQVFMVLEKDERELVNTILYNWRNANWRLINL